MVRIITCWCLSRYVQWVLLPPGNEDFARRDPHTAPPRVAPENEVRPRKSAGLSDGCCVLAWLCCGFCLVDPMQVIQSWRALLFCSV